MHLDDLPPTIQAELDEQLDKTITFRVGDIVRAAETVAEGAATDPEQGEAYSAGKQAGALAVANLLLDDRR
jgi:hypothetical protein